MVLRLPRAAEREYLATYGIVAVYVAALPSGPSWSASRAICCTLSWPCAADGLARSSPAPIG
jgi:hypothetical protein